MRRDIRIAVIAGGGIAAWTLMASAAYVWLGKVPPRCWFYYAVPWPDDFLWSGLFLILSGALATVPFAALAARKVRQRRSGSDLYGKTEWPDAGEMRQGGIGRSSRP